MNPTKITQEQLKSFVSYDAELGELYWKKHRFSAFVGCRVGSIVPRKGCRTEYIQTKLYGKTYYIHQLIWLYETGELPDHELDHKDRNGLNNRFSNLREVTRSQQNMNKAPQNNSASGVTGVTPFRDKWQVSIKRGGYKHHLGTFSNFDEAVEVRKIAEKALFGEFSCASN